MTQLSGSRHDTYLSVTLQPVLSCRAARSQAIASSEPADAPAATLTPEAKGRNKPHQPPPGRLRITSKRPTVHNRLETPQGKAKRDAARKRAVEYRQRRKENADRRVGDYLYDGRLLMWLKACIRPATGQPYLSEEAIKLGESERRGDLRKYDLALREAVTDFLDDVLKGHVIL